MDPDRDDCSCRIGVLCLLDDEPHTVTTHDISQLTSIANLLSRQIVQQIEEQNARRQARMHKATIGYMNRSMQLVNAGDPGMEKTCHTHLPTGFSLFSGAQANDGHEASERMIPFVTPQPADQTVEKELYVSNQSLSCLWQMLTDLRPRFRFAHHRNQISRGEESLEGPGEHVTDTALDRL